MCGQAAAAWAVIQLLGQWEHEVPTAGLLASCMDRYCADVIGLYHLASKLVALGGWSSAGNSVCACASVSALSALIELFAMKACEV